MEKPAETQYDIHDLLKTRWSPRAFSNQAVEPEQLLSLFEAARWSPSAGNMQPWAFIVVTPNDKAIQEKFVEAMTGRNPDWAKDAPVLVLAVAKTDARAGRFVYYDVGQAMAHLSVQAAALGLSVHQMAGFDSDKVRQLFELPEDYDTLTVTAIGYQGDLETLPEDLREREKMARTRKPLSEFVFNGHWNQPLEVTDAQSSATAL